jgi:hypothetical protein
MTELFVDGCCEKLALQHGRILNWMTEMTATLNRLEEKADRLLSEREVHNESFGDDTILGLIPVSSEEDFHKLENTLGESPSFHRKLVIVFSLLLLV